MNANDIQKWINHLTDEEKNIPIYLKDENNYYGADNVHHSLNAVRVIDGEVIPPNDFFEVKIHQYKDARMSKYLLEHPLPFKEMFDALHVLLDKYEMKEGASCTDDICKGIVGVINLLYMYDNCVTREYLKYADLHEEKGDHKTIECMTTEEE